MLASLRGAAVVSVLFAGSAAAQSPRTDGLGDPLPPGAIARLGTSRFRHDEKVLSLAFSPDGKTLASAGADGAVCLWDTATGKRDRKLSVHEGPVTVVLFGPDGSVLVIATPTDVSVWSAQGRLLYRLPLKTRGKPALSADGRWLAVNNDGNVHVRDARTGRERCVIATGRSVRGLALSPDGSLLAVPLAEVSLVRLYDVATGKKLRTYESGENNALVAAFAPDGKRLATADEGNSVSVWETRSEEAVVSFTSAQGDAVIGLSFTDNGKALTLLHNDGSVGRYDAANGHKQEVFDAKAEDDKLVFALSADGKRLASAIGNVIRVHDLATGKDSPDLGEPTRYVDAAWVPRSGVVALRTGAKSLLLWEPGRVGEPRRLDPPQDGAFVLSFSPDGKTVVSVDKAVGLRLWDVATGEQVREIRLEEGKQVRSAAFALEGRLLVVDCEDDLLMFDSGTGGQRLVLMRAEGRASYAAFTRDSRSVFVQLNTPELRLWEVATGKERRRVPLDAPASCLAVSPDGADLAAGEEGGEVRLYSLSRGATQHRLFGHKGKVWAVAFSPGGKLLATGGNDGLVRLWNPVTGRAVCRLGGLGGAVSHLAFSADGKSLVTVGGGTTVLVWDVAEVLALPLPTPPLRAPADLWADLASDDAARADAALRALVDQPAEALPLLKDRLRPVAPVEAGVLARLGEDLDSDDFGTRQRAAKELRALSHLAEPTLRRLLEGKPSPEVRQTAEELLALLNDQVPDPERLRVLRGVEALEAIGTSEARQALKTLAAGAAGARLTEEARAASERLRRRADAPR
jgi:WD40 repeat protein